MKTNARIPCDFRPILIKHVYIILTISFETEHNKSQWWQQLMMYYMSIYAKSQEALKIWYIRFWSLTDKQYCSIWIKNYCKTTIIKIKIKTLVFQTDILLKLIFCILFDRIFNSIRISHLFITSGLIIELEQIYDIT